LTFLWAWGAALVITTTPVWEGRATIAAFFTRMIMGKKPIATLEGHPQQGEDLKQDEPNKAFEEKGVRETATSSS